VHYSCVQDVVGLGRDRGGLRGGGNKNEYGIGGRGRGVAPKAVVVAHVGLREVLVDAWLAILVHALCSWMRAGWEGPGYQT